MFIVYNRPAKLLGTINSYCLREVPYYVMGEKNVISFTGPPLQAFLELNSEECAQTMVSYYSSVTPVIRNHPIYMQYSTHKELKTDNSPNQVVRACTHTCTLKLGVHEYCLDFRLKLLL